MIVILILALLFLAGIWLHRKLDFLGETDADRWDITRLVDQP